MINLNAHFSRSIDLNNLFFFLQFICYWFSNARAKQITTNAKVNNYKWSSEIRARARAVRTLLLYRNTQHASAHCTLKSDHRNWQIMFSLLVELWLLTTTKLLNELYTSNINQADPRHDAFQTWLKIVYSLCLSVCLLNLC